MHQSVALDLGPDSALLLSAGDRVCLLVGRLAVTWPHRDCLGTRRAAVNLPGRYLGKGGQIGVKAGSRHGRWKTWKTEGSTLRFIFSRLP